jgi:hypothetical protein
MAELANRIVVRRDRSVVLDGEIIGSVWGEPRDWWFMLADCRTPARTHEGGWHSKRDAAEMCVRAHRETPPRGSGR